MNEEKFKKEVEDRWGGDGRHRRHGGVWAGLLLLIIGGLLLLKTAELVIFPAWFFTWPVLFIAVGLFSGLRHGFRGPLWIIFMLIGGLNLAEIIDPSMNLHRFMWPLIFIIVGLIFIFRPKRSRWSRCRDRRYYRRWHREEAAETPYAYDNTTGSADADRGDFVDVTSVFGGVKKKRIE